MTDENMLEPDNSENNDTPAGDETPMEDDFSVFEDDLGPDSILVQVQGKLEEAEEELARARAEIYNVRQEYAGYVRRAKGEAALRREEGRADVIEALLAVLDDIEAARLAGELGSGPFAAISEKLEETLRSRFETVRFGAAGEDFDPQLHDALMAATNPEVDRPIISQVLQSGYKVGERVLRPTKVMVDNPE